MARKNPVVTPPTDPSADDRHEPASSGQRRRPGAPANNQNAGKHLAYSKVRAKRERRTRRRWILDLRAKIAEAYGLEDEPLLDLVGEPLADLDGMRRALSRKHERGIQNRRGEIHSSVKLAIDTCGAIIREARQVVDRIVEMHGTAARSEDEARQKIAAITARWPGALAFRILDATGEPFAFGFGQGGARAPLALDPVAADPFGPSRASGRATASRRGSGSASARQARASGRAGSGDASDHRDAGAASLADVRGRFR
jgi:hypothetical protein